MQKIKFLIPIFFLMVILGLRFKKIKILKLSNKDGRTVAHIMAWKGYEFTDQEILKLTDDWGRTVAHAMAVEGYEFTDPEILKLADNKGVTIAHEMAWQDHKFTDPEILKLADRKGRTIAHQMAARGYKFYDPEILKMAEDDEGRTVAHEMAARGRGFTDPEILKLSASDGWTVAHEMVLRGYEFTDQKILGVSDNNGETVAGVCDEIHKTDRFSSMLNQEREKIHFNNEELSEMEKKILMEIGFYFKGNVYELGIKEIKFNFDTSQIHICLARPGLLIGKHGRDIKNLENIFKEVFKQHIHIVLSESKIDFWMGAFEYSNIDIDIDYL